MSSESKREWLGLVRTAPGRKVFREGYLRDEDDGIFRLYETPPPFDVPSREPYEGERAEDVPTTFDKWLGSGLEEVKDQYEIDAFLHSAANTEFADQVSADNVETVMGRAGAITQGVHQLDHGNDSHWTDKDLPNPKAVGELTGLVNVSASEVTACVPEVRRLPADKRQRNAAPRRSTERG